MRIVLGGDHAGFALKAAVADHLTRLGHEVEDLGTDSEEPVDYPAFCAGAARVVVAGRADLGMVFGGSGQGEQMAANKVHGARAALCQDEFMARLARQHNDANILALGGRVLAVPVALAVVDAFLGTPFEGGRHQPRLDQMSAIEVEECQRGTDRPTFT